jgi:hypothetical protein
MVKTNNQGDLQPAGDDSPENQDRVHAESEPRYDAGNKSGDRHDMANDAPMLDEIETLLQELGMEFEEAERPAANHDTRLEQEMAVSEESTSGEPLPIASESGLRTPADIAPDRSEIDNHQASERAYHADSEVRSIAKKLVPMRDDAEPSPEPLTDRLGAAGYSGPDSVFEDRQGANLVSSYTDRSRVESVLHNPRLPRPPVGWFSHRSVIGACLTVLLIASVAAALGFIEPLNRLLPERVSFTSDITSRGNVEAKNQSVGDGKSANDATQNLETETSAGALQAINDETDNNKIASKRDMAVDQAGLSGNDRTGLVNNINHPDIAEVERPTTVSAARLAETIDAESSLTGTIESGKSEDRIAQAPVIEPILMDSKSSVPSPTTDFEPVTTGAISNPISNEGIARVASVIEEGSTATTEFGDPAPKQKGSTVTITELWPNMSFDDMAKFGMQEITDPQVGTPASDVNLPAPKGSQPVISISPNETGLGDKSSDGSATDVDSLLARGHKMLQRGDIATARLLFLRVFEMGDSRGANGMGMTFDPKVYQDLPIAWLLPDIEQAELWYRKAGEMSESKVASDPAAVSKN